MAVSEASPMEALIGFYVEASRIAPLIVVQLVAFRFEVFLRHTLFVMEPWIVL